MRLRIKLPFVVVFLQYDTGKYPRSFERLKSYLRKVDKQRVTYFLVNNRDVGDGARKLDDHTIYLQGDNTDWEFSGWQKAVQFMRQNNIEHQVVLFVNDSFEVNGPGYLSWHSISWLVFKTFYLRSVFGLFATRWAKAQVKGRTIRTWLGTDCFFVPKSLLDRLGTLVSISEESMVQYMPINFPGLDNLFLDNATINREYRSSIVKWLTEEWHSKFVPDEESWPFFRAKVKAILNEATLYVRIRELGYMVFPYDIPVFVLTKIRGAFRKLKEVVSRRS